MSFLMEKHQAFIGFISEFSKFSCSCCFTSETLVYLTARQNITLDFGNLWWAMVVILEFFFD